MAITPQAGYIVDPNNPNGVIRDPNIGNASNTVITSTSLQNEPQIQLPQQPQSLDYSGTTGMTQAMIDANSAIVKANQDAIAKANETTTPSATDTYKADLQGVQTPDLAGLFKSTYDTPEFKAKQDAYTASKNKLDAYNAQLAGLMYQKDTVIPNQQQQDVLSRGITTAAGLAPLTAAAQRTKLLEIAPIQYQTLLAQAEATGNANILNAAQSHLDKVFSIMSQDAQNKYEFKLKTIDAVYQAADKKEQRILDQQKTDLATNNTTYTNYINDIQTAIKSATDSGDTALAGQISQLINQPLDPNSKTFKTDYQKALSKLATYQAQIGKKGTGEIKAPTIQKINGVDMQWNPKTGKWENPTTGSTGSPALQVLATTKANVDSIDEIIKSSGLSSSVGTSFLTRKPTGFFGNLGATLSIAGIPSVIGGAYRSLTGDRQNFISGVEQVRSQLNLDKLIQSKAQGATFGALSDNELRVLASAGTKLGTWAEKDSDGNITGYNTSQDAFKKEMEKISNFAKLDYIVKGGNPSDVNGRIQSDGTIWVLNDSGTYTQIK